MVISGNIQLNLWRKALQSIVVLFLFWRTFAVAAAEPFFPFFEPVVPPRAFQVMVHRGMCQAAPENTRRAIEMCAEDGLEWAEVDVH